MNARLLLPVADYFPGVPLPPHLSPFVSEKEGDYVPPEKVKLLALQRGEQPGERGGLGRVGGPLRWPFPFLATRWQAAGNRAAGHKPLWSEVWGRERLRSTVRC